MSAELAGFPAGAPAATRLPHGAPQPLALTQVGKEYRLYDSPLARLKALLTGRATHRSHWALRDVSFELQRGQCLGVVGSNGAGKSTLLKLVTGTLQPTTGRVQRYGRVTAILELGAGFHPDFTGRQNLYFSGSLIGIPSDEMARLEPQVLAFAEIGEAIDRPVKTYSSGMAMRLAFALVTAVEPDLLIIDEALAVGDQHFQKRCIDRIRDFRENGCTILFCSHSSYHVRHLCDVALWLDQGRVMEIGATETVLAAYEKHTRQLDERLNAGHATMGEVGSAARGASQSASMANVLGKGDLDAAAIVSCDIANLCDQGETQPPLLQSRDLVVTITARGKGDECPQVGFMLVQDHGVGITSLSTLEDGVALTRVGRPQDHTWRITLSFPDLPLHTGDYTLTVYLFDASGLVIYDQWFQCKVFRFVTPTRLPGLVQLPHHWN
ncbi:MAG: ABC transporter ATP-binding protein [Burkholderiaceae bacterium]|jgi:lipopolysaccharide transport system ATP-binding protein|nr:ABC transporter ATP-binding protein [Burkholderiaceae bacterium]